MAPPIDLDIAGLLTPFGDDAPAGVDPREDASAQSLYYRLRDARAEARDTERRSDGEGMETGGPAPQWRTVRDLSLQTLGKRAKDLEVAAWLTEALVREAGFAGLMAGATLIRDLAEAFWDSGLFPLPDEDGITTLVAPVSGLNGVTGEGTLAQALRKQVMYTRGDGTEITFWEYFQAEEVEGIGDAGRKKARLDAGVPAFSSVDGEARAVGASHFGRLRAELDAALLAWNSMAGVLDGKAGADAPSTGRVRDLLVQLLGFATRYAPAASAEPAESAATPLVPGEPAAIVPGGAGPAAVAAAAISREDMLTQLSRIADFFRRNEPQSPLSRTLEEAVRRARLSWEELLLELMEDQSARDAVTSQLGIRPKKPEEEE